MSEDNSQREQFPSGAVRDGQSSKPRYDLIPLYLLEALQHSFGGAMAKADTSNPPIVDVPALEDCAFDLIPDEMLFCLGHLFKTGSDKYSPRNWEAGMPFSRGYASLLRHLIAWASGDTTERHIVNVVWNATVLLCYEIWVDQGRLDKSLADAGPLKFDFGNEQCPTPAARPDVMRRIQDVLRDIDKGDRFRLPHIRIFKDGSGSVYEGAEEIFDFHGFDGDPENPNDFFSAYQLWLEDSEL